jgi:glycerol-3-phosphate O-acyltransferase
MVVEADMARRVAMDMARRVAMVMARRDMVAPGMSRREALAEEAMDISRIRDMVEDMPRREAMEGTTLDINYS